MSARMRKPSVQQPWKTHVPTVSEIEGPVAVGLMDIEVVEVEARDVVELLLAELVVLVEVARERVVEVDELEVADEVIDEYVTEVERDAVLADVTLETDERPAGPPGTRELNHETPDNTVADEGRLTMEEAVPDDNALVDGAPGALGGADTALDEIELDIDAVVLVVVVETRELAEDTVAKVVHVVEDVLEPVPEDIVEVKELELDVVEDADEVEVAGREVELVEELIIELLLEVPELERLVALLVDVEIPEEDMEVEALLRPPAKLPNTLSEVLNELVEELVEALLVAEVDTEPLVLVEEPIDVELPEVDEPLEERLPLDEVKDDDSAALEEMDATALLVETIEAELEATREALNEVATKEPTLLLEDRAAIEVGNELL
ncbi:hypothetical protein IL306_007432 [Fusarium sp. DS 682]|nr:hypothetical protein IL306_007432 [Fusarium sp. DS 682]